MGMYTGLYVKVLVKREYRQMVEMVMLHNWEIVRQHFPLASEWSKKTRCEFIPHGPLCYMPREFPRQCNTFKDGVWEFSCSLKDYEDEIDTFIGTVLAPIVEEVEQCYSLYETHRDVYHYFNEDGTLKDFVIS